MREGIGIVAMTMDNDDNKNFQLLTTRQRRQEEQPIPRRRSGWGEMDPKPKTFFHLTQFVLPVFGGYIERRRSVVRRNFEEILTGTDFSFLFSSAGKLKFLGPNKTQIALRNCENSTD